ncbi:hypothetical protein HD553DRAFT_343094 [Filobasidium floriforme]|uniref:uncharacterized protein n=1 Tax=Filobasidium floriforme TaxID=5210 RepID=UPI001E8D4045|nr:uncharacterized protein HD553DRAFT_343094 [Filobasidium floriforme]KAH8083101.1 hypothetical protein HD553DRAFT_343094 [Filobasidium floriforme]
MTGPARTNSGSSAYSPYGRRTGGRDHTAAPAFQFPPAFLPLSTVHERSSPVSTQQQYRPAASGRTREPSANPEQNQARPRYSSVNYNSSPPPSSPSPSTGLTLPDSFIPQASAFSSVSSSVPRDQRQTLQQLQSLQATNEIYARDIRAIGERLVAAEALIEGLAKRVTEQDGIIGEGEETIKDLKARVEELEDVKESSQYVEEMGHQVEPGGEGRRCLKIFIKSAIKVLHGCEAPVLPPLPGQTMPLLTTASGDSGSVEAMRWDYTKKFRDKANAIQTQRLLEFVEKRPGDVPLPNDCPRDSIPAYDINTNVYVDCIREVFTAYRKSLANAVCKTWESETKELVESAIATLETSLAGPDPSGDPGDVTRWKAYVSEINKMIAAEQTDEKGNVRSKLVVLARQIKGKRMHTRFHGPEYASLDEIHGLPAPIPVKSAEGAREWYWPDMPSVFSAEYGAVFDEIYGTRDPLVKNQTEIATESPADFTFPTYQHYFATTAPKLHENPQRWMFRREWLATVPHDIQELRIVPVDQPMSPDDVKQTPWYLNHPQRLGRSVTAASSKKKGKASGKKPAVKIAASPAPFARSSQASVEPLSGPSQSQAGSSTEVESQISAPKETTRIMKGRTGAASSSVTPRSGLAGYSQPASQSSQTPFVARQPQITDHLYQTRPSVAGSVSGSSQSKHSQQMVLDPTLGGSTYNRHSLRSSTQEPTHSNPSHFGHHSTGFVPPMRVEASAATTSFPGGSNAGLQTTLYQGSPGLGRTSDPNVGGSAVGSGSQESIREYDTPVDTRYRYPSDSPGNGLC